MTIERPAAEQTDLTVLICTLNRPESLKETLQLLARNDFNHARLNVVVIDNALAQTARSVTESMSAELSVRYLHEPTPGKSHALNHALEADGLAPIVAVLDDDMSPGPEWCREILDVTARWSQAGVFAAASYVIWPDGAELPDWIQRASISCWALSVANYTAERCSKPGESMSGNYFWFRRDVIGTRRFEHFWCSETRFILGLIEDGTTGVVGPRPRCGHRIQPNLLRLDVQRDRATKFGSFVPRFRQGFTKTVPQVQLAAKRPLLWRLLCFANLLRWLLVAASTPFRHRKNRIPKALLARIGIANNLGCLRLGSHFTTEALSSSPTQIP